MSTEVRAQAVREIKELIERVEKSRVAFDIEGSDELVIKGSKTRGYSKVVKTRNVKKVQLEKQDHEAPSLSEYVEIIQAYRDLVEIVGAAEPDERSRIEKVLESLAPYGSWVNLAYNVLIRNGFF